MANTALVWIRDDFRIQNNDALTYATNQHDAVTAVFIFNSNIFIRERRRLRTSPDPAVNSSDHISKIYYNINKNRKAETADLYPSTSKLDGGD